MPVLRLFAAAREVAGVARVDIDGSTVAEILETACQRYGDRFGAVLAQSRVWVNGQPARGDTPVSDRDVVAVIPPVSGGAGGAGLSGAPERATGPGLEHATVARPRQSTVSGRRGWYVGPNGPEWRGGPGREPPRPEAEARPAVTDRSLRSDAEDGVAREQLHGRAGEAVAGNGQRTAPRPRPRPAEPATVPDDEVTAGDPLTVSRAPAAPAAPAPDPSLHGQEREVRGFRKSLHDDTIPRLQKLAVVFSTKRPHGRLGLVWALLVFGTTIAGAQWLAAVLSVTAFVGACQAVSVRRALGERPVPVLAAATALALPLSAAWGMGVFGITLGVAIGLTVVMCLLFPTRASLGDIASTLAIGGLLGLAAASPVLLRSVRLDATLLLLAYAAAYDAGAYLVGTGATNTWEGPAAGVVALIPVTILSTVILVPPFPPGGPLLLGALAATLAPLGPLVGTALVGNREADVPGLRRLDSLLLLGPLWAVGAASLV